MDVYKGECYYGRCWLPKNNKKYLWQVAIIAVSVFVLFITEESFTFFSLFLVVSPVMLDIINTELKSKGWNVVRVLFGILNGALLLCSALGFAKVLVDTGSSFAFPPTFMFWPGLAIKKQYIGIAVIFDIAVPLIFWIGAPCQEALHTLEEDKMAMAGKEESE